MNKLSLAGAGACAGALLTGVAVLVAGPLTPPAGPVAPTYKTLTEVEPRTAVNATNTPGDATSVHKITQPGSYYLTGNIAGVNGKHGIAIAVSGVTLDLRGFQLVGVAGSLDGVNAAVAGLANIAVTNGSISGWGGSAVNLNIPIVTGCRLENLTASGNFQGLRSGQAATVTGCSASNNTSLGIGLGTYSTMSNCSATANGSGMSVGNHSAVTNCTASSNAGAGLSLGNGVTLTACSANFNTGSGISASFADTISGCSVQGNTGDGISATGGCTVTDCDSRGNFADGIVCNNSCVVRGNLCDTNGNGAAADGADIHITGGDNRVEANNCTLADRGIEVGGAGNIVIRNTCSGNTLNWVIAANNVLGPILDRTAPASGAVSGNSAPDSTGSTHPNANFTF